MIRRLSSNLFERRGNTELCGIGTEEEGLGSRSIFGDRMWQKVGNHWMQQFGTESGAKDLA